MTIVTMRINAVDSASIMRLAEANREKLIELTANLVARELAKKLKEMHDRMVIETLYGTGDGEPKGLLSN